MLPNFCRHKSVHITDPDGSATKIDENILPLVRAFWDMGFKIIKACEGDAKFVDQTDPDAKRFTADIKLVRTPEVVAFIVDILENFYAFRAEKCLWGIEFSRNSITNENRVELNFPHQDIQKLLDYIAMRKECEELEAAGRILI